MAAPMKNVNKMKHDGKFHANMLFVSGIPYSVTNDKLGEIFSEIGPIKNCFVVKDKDSSVNKGFGYVKFSLFKDAERAIEEVTVIGGRKIKVNFADSSKKIKRPRRVTTEILEEKLLQNAEIFEESTMESKSSSGTDHKSSSGTDHKTVSVDRTKSVDKQNVRKNRARIIIRNLHFACDAATLQSKFEKFGGICDVHIAKKGPKGQSMGVGFVQFNKMKAASRAIEEVNATKILGRVVAVDWVVDKDVLTSAVENVNEEQDEGNETGEEDSAEISEGDTDESNDDEDDDEDGDEDEDEDDTEEITPAKIPRIDKVQPHRESDVKQGRTLFIRNLPFDAHEDDLEEMISEFGVMNYCLLVKDRDTGMCKGSAFVQFASKHNAENCLKKCNTEEGCLVLNGRRLGVTVAMDKKDLTNNADIGREKTDRRNMHLLREGMIREGSQAAINLTKTDLLLRKKIEDQMKVKLKNPAIFISPTRLVVNNLPYNVDDASLKAAMMKAGGGKGVRIIECRIMRHLSQIKAGGVACSMGYAFVEYTSHDHALTALHATSNTDVFSQNRMLIVHFSLENRNILEFKRKRQLRAAMKDPSKNAEQTSAAGASKNLDKKPQRLVKSHTSVVPLVKGNKPKSHNMFPSHSGPKIRHKVRNTQPNKRDGAKQKQQSHDVKSVQDKRKKRHSRPKKEIRDTFDSLVLKYKKQLLKAL